MNTSTGPTRRNGQGLVNRAAVSTNNAAVAAVNAQTDAGDTSPAGSARAAVRGLAASSRRSARRLAAIAVERANAMAGSTSSTSRHDQSAYVCVAQTALRTAKGRANNV